MVSLKKFKQSRKNFLPTIIIIIGLWILLGIIIAFVDPLTSGAITIFLFILFLALFFTLSMLLVNTRRGIFTSSAITIYLALASNNQGNVLNFLLIAGSLIAFEIYFATRA